jgi:uncharacterized protein
MAVRELPARPARHFGVMWIVLLLLALLIGSRSIAQLIIEYEWWKELGQVQTWQNIILYSFAPVVIAAVLAFAVLWLVHARALKFAGTGLSEHRGYARLSSLVLLLLSLLIARASLDSWTIVSYYGAQRAGTVANPWRDPMFGHTLSFYLFDLPFYSQLLGLILAITIVGALLFYIAARMWQLAGRAHRWREEAVGELQPADLMLAGGLESAMLRGLVAVVLLAFAARAWLGRLSCCTRTTVSWWASTTWRITSPSLCNCSPPPLWWLPLSLF